jgi:hypothetical protein
MLAYVHWPDRQSRPMQEPDPMHRPV